MKSCTYCGYSNYDTATLCRKCDSPFVFIRGTIYGEQKSLMGRPRLKLMRDRALSMVVLGLLIKVYWGGYGPWPVIDYPALVSIRAWLEPLLLYGGIGLYVLGLIGQVV